MDRMLSAIVYYSKMKIIESMQYDLITKKNIKQPVLINNMLSEIIHAKNLSKNKCT